jgi:hypothetical protein
VVENRATIYGDGHHMNVHVDENKYDELQMRLLCAIVEAIHTSLKTAGLAPNQLRELVTTLAFNICCIVDSSAVIHTKNGLLHPVLTFALDPEKIELLSAGGPSWMHEYVHGVVDEHFQAS